MNEKALFDIISSAVEELNINDWELCFQRRLNRQAREIDVLVAIPQYGLLILELKGWRGVGVGPDGRMYKTDNGRRSQVGDPFVQLSAEITAISEFIRDHTKDRPTLMGGVVFAGLSANSISELSRHAPASFPAELMFSREDFPRVSIGDARTAQQTIERLRKFAVRESPRHRRPHHRNDAESLSRVVRALKAQTEADFLDMQLKEIVESVETNTEYSLTLLQAPLNGMRRLHVTGPAGTGKTVLALSIALERSQRLELPSIFLCFSPHLRKHILERRGWMIGDAVWVETPETLYERVVGRPFNAEETEFSNSSQDTDDLGLSSPHDVWISHRLYVCEDSFWLEVLAAMEEQNLEFAAICIDEGQDFWGLVFDALDQTICDQGLFGIFADPHQNTRDSGALRAYQVERPGFHSVTLTTNLRNPTSIVRAINKRFQPEISYATSTQVAEGRPPSIASWATNEQLQDALSTVEIEIERTGSSDVVVLYDSLLSDKHLDIVARKAELRSWDVRRIEDFRGLEADVVISVLSEGAGLKGTVEGIWQQQYVALSRSRGFSYILEQSGSSSIIKASTTRRRNRGSPQ